MQESFEKKLAVISSKLPIGCFKKLVFFPVISSTNQKAKELACSAESDGIIVVAEQQSQGRGRFNRFWESPKGGLYFSFVLKPMVAVEKTSFLPLITALAVVQTVCKFGLAASIKWPNDVHIHGKKIAGILLESECQKSCLEYVVVGVGINGNILEFSSELKEKATSLYRELDHPVDLILVLSEFLMWFNQYYSYFLDEKYEYIRDEWKDKTDTLGKQVCISQGSEEIVGTAVDIDDFGFLLVRTNQGCLKKVSSGDCVY